MGRKGIGSCSCFTEAESWTGSVPASRCRIDYSGSVSVRGGVAQSVGATATTSHRSLSGQLQRHHAEGSWTRRLRGMHRVGR